MSELKVNKVTPSTGTQVEIEATSILLDGTVTTATVTNATGVAVQHNGNTKLATTSTGVTVTGTLTAGNFTGNGSGLTNVTATGVGGSSSAGSLSIVSDNANSGTAGNDIVLITGTAERGRIYRSSGDVRFNTDTLCVDAANQRVGIETASPAYTLDVSGTARSTGSIVGTGGMTVDTDVLVVDATNNRVGVNKAAPSTALDVTGTITATAVTVGNGTLTAGQIAFPATQNPSSNANTLDDYEEGTFLPVVIGSTTAGTATYQGQTGTYTKVGRLVFFDVYLQWTGGTGTGNLRISLGSLPNAISNPSVAIGLFENVAMTANYFPSAYMSSNAVIFVQTPVGGGNTIVIPYDGAGVIYCSGTYMTT